MTALALAAALQVSFRNDVQPILARYGCSGGACHGALAGKNGFKLSLRGYDDAGDHRAITRHALGRRVNLAEPARSLLLLKPTGAVSHKGGVRFEAGSPPWRVLADWIASGAPGPRDEDPRIEGIRFEPEASTLAAGQKRPLRVQAKFSDGAVRDVTSLVKFTITDSSVAAIDEAGEVKAVGHGESAVTAWFLSRIAVATVTVPFPHAAPAAAAGRTLIDERVLEKLKILNLTPSPLASDAEFLRRAFLDTIGLLPTPEEARAFLADAAADKRDRLIESLLARPEFVDYWTHRWSDLLLVTSARLPKPAMMAYAGWIRAQVAADAPWDAMVRRLVTATGGTLENGAAAFYLLHDDPTEMSETVSQAFLGMSIQCAKCHNHPMEKWTNDQYYGMANLFARVRSKNGTRDGDIAVFVEPAGDVIQPLTGRPQAPRPLDAEALAFEAPADRRERLADWLVARDNPYFARAVVNRVWANFMGTGLVEGVDDMRKTNPPSNEKLLDELARTLADRGFRLKELMRLILQSHAYQRSSRPLPENVADRRFYARFLPRRLKAEVALDALSQVTGAPTVFKDVPAGRRAIEVPDAAVESYFLKSFGRAERTITCECERSNEPSMAQVLHLANGDTLNQKLKAPDNRIARLLAAKAADEAIIEEIYLAALSRFPVEAEKEKLKVLLTDAAGVDRREVIEDLFWSVLSSREFLFNH